MSWSAEPFLLRPAGKDYLWGGRRLRDDFSKDIDMEPLAETWECSTHPDGVSVVASGEHEGMELTELLRAHPEYLGAHPSPDGSLPILIKLIDAERDLSIQVHPDDEYARANENGALGKSEMWYVLDAKRDAALIYGFKDDIGRDALLGALERGEVLRYLQRVPVRKGDVFFIPAGQVHAICAGALICEVQQSSNITYRLYDYDRVDKRGDRRALHIEKALDVADLRSSAEPRQPMRVLHFQKGAALELLCRCKYFQVERMLINTERVREMAAIQTGASSFETLLCTDGCGVLYWGEGRMINFYKGDCIFIPARSVPIRIHGQAELLKVSC